MFHLKEQMGSFFSLVPAVRMHQAGLECILRFHFFSNESFPQGKKKQWRTFLLDKKGTVPGVKAGLSDNGRQRSPFSSTEKHAIQSQVSQQCSKL